MGMEEVTPKPPGSARSTCAQVLAVSAINWFPINVGLLISMPVIINGALMSGQSSPVFTEEDASWFGGLIYIMQPPGSVICGFLQDLLGRKTCFMLICIPQLGSWLLLYFGTSVTTLFLASGTLGFSMGFMEAPTMSYISEITEPRLRDLLASIANISFNVGILALFFVGALVDWRTMVLISALGPIMAFISIAMVPDSPAWLLTRGKVDDAQKAFQWLRGWVSPHIVQQELEAMISFVQKDREHPVVLTKTMNGELKKEAGDKHAGSTEFGLEAFFQPAIQRPMRLILLYFLTSSCASLLPIRPFYIDILDSMDLPIASLNIMAIGGALTLLGSSMATFVIHRIGIRGLTFVSMNLSATSALGIGVYLALGMHLPWIPLIFVFVSFFAGPLGILFIPFILISELFPLRGKGFASGVTAALAYLMMFVITKTYFSIVSVIGLSGAFIFYGVVGFVGFVYLYFTLPETEGMSLEVIQARFAGKKGNMVCSEKRTEEEGPLRTTGSVAV